MQVSFFEGGVRAQSTGLVYNRVREDFMTRKLLLTIITGILVVGGLFMAFSLTGDKQLSKEEQRNREYEVSLVKALKNTYRDIESISIKNPRYNEKPGDWSCYVELVFVDDIKVGYNMSHSLNEIENSSAIAHPDIIFTLSSRYGKTINDITAYYSDGKSEVIE